MATNLATTHAVKPLRNTTVIIMISVALLYLATLTADYYWDGITFALQVEKVARMERGAYLLFHQNHLFYNALGYLVYALIRALSFPTRSLHVLQIPMTGFPSNSWEGIPWFFIHAR